MQLNPTRHLLPRASLAVGLGLALCLPALAQDTAGRAPLSTTAARLMERCQELRDRKQSLNDDVKAQDAALTQQLASMNAAPADRQVGLMAALLTQLVEQRIAMDARRSQWDDAMLRHMAGHMQMGGDSMANCPMMRGMRGQGSGLMGALPAASDTERAFLQTMVPHHEMAIEMAKLAQQKARSRALRNMASETIQTQGDQIVQMEAIHQRLFGSALKPDMMAHDRLGLTMEESGLEMDLDGLRTARSFDRSYAEKMIGHHQGAINMARKVMQTTNDVELRNLADSIIEVQTKEIVALKKTL